MIFSTKNQIWKVEDGKFYNWTNGIGKECGSFEEKDRECEILEVTTVFMIFAIPTQN